MAKRINDEENGYSQAPLEDIFYSPVTRKFTYCYVKRAIDLIIVILGLIYLSPLLLFIAILVKFTSPGPIFFPLEWAGYKGVRFKGYKFRTMVENADEIRKALEDQNEMQGPAFKLRYDPRITTVGKVLRKFSLDELPQLWSVLKGDMSLIGPRPSRVEEFKQYRHWQNRRMSVMPGLSCLWQVNGRNQVSNFDDWVRMDLEYIDNWSLWLDFKIFLKSIVVVFQGTGY
jgi:lipopolysaccharide/colanic/teichoic acid biosynthesis glycosyltransferase